jgi:hypothetical protein
LRHLFPHPFHPRPFQKLDTHNSSSGRGLLREETKWGFFAFSILCSNMRHIGTQCGFPFLTSSILSQKYRRCHFIHQITGYEWTRMTSVSGSTHADHYWVIR